MGTDKELKGTILRGNVPPSLLSEVGRSETEKSWKRVQIKLAIVMIT